MSNKKNCVSSEVVVVLFKQCHWMIVAAISVGLANPALAQGSDAYSLGEIVVNGSLSGTTGIESVQTVTRKQIQEEGAHTLDQALRLLPGISIRTGGDGTPRIDIHGLRTRDVKLLINGVPVYSTYDGQFDPRLIPTNQIARINVVTGASSELYGDGAMAGVIDIITRKGQGPAHGSVAAEAGSDNYKRIAADISGSSGNLSTFFTASHLSRDDYSLAKDYQATALQPAGKRTNSDQKFGNIYGNLLYTPNSSWQYGLTMTHVNGEYGIPPSTLNSSTDIFANKAKYERITGLNGYSVQGIANYNPSGSWSMRNWIFINDQWQQDSIFDNANLDSFLKHNSASTRQETLTAGGHVQLNWSTQSQGKLGIALNARRERWTEVGFIRDLSLGGGKYAPRTVNDNLHVDVASLSMQYSIKPWQHTGLVAGAGYHQQYRTEGNYSGESFVAGVYHEFSKISQGHISVARKIGLPSIRQLYDSTSGDSNLKPEHTLKYEIGTNIQWSKDSTLSATAYSMIVKNYIQKDQATNKYTNYERYHFRGIDLSDSTRLSQQWHLRATYAYLWSRDESAGTTIEQLEYRPSYTLGATLSYTLPKGWYGDLSALRVGHQYYYSRTTPYQKAVLDPYSTINLLVGYHFSKFYNGVDVYLRTNNLTDANYEQSYGFPQAGRSIYVGARMKF